jgi:hypothetical protein
LPIDIFLKSFNYIGYQESDILDKEYNQVYFLLEGYERVNPVTMKKGKLNYLDKMFEKEIITEADHIKFTKQVMENEPVNIVEIYNANKEKDINYLQFKPNTFKDNINYNTNNIFKNQTSKFFKKMLTLKYMMNNDVNLLPKLSSIIGVNNKDNSINSQDNKLVIKKQHQNDNNNNDVLYHNNHGQINIVKDTDRVLVTGNNIEMGRIRLNDDRMGSGHLFENTKLIEDKDNLPNTNNYFYQ